jgi:hypothetical protein
MKAETIAKANDFGCLSETKITGQVCKQVTWLDLPNAKATLAWVRWLIEVYYIGLLHGLPWLCWFPKSKEVYPRIKDAS